MTDLRDRFRSARTMEAPDLWRRINRHRVEAGVDVDLGRDALEPRARIGAAAVAIAASVAAAMLVWSAFGKHAPTPLMQDPTPSPTGTSAARYQYLPPFFRETGPWHVRDSGMANAGDGATAWASNVAFDPSDLEPRAPAIPPATIEQLPPNGIVLTALVVTHENEAESGPWPPGSLEIPDLSDATVRGPQAEEPPGDYAVYQVDGYASIRVYFGSPDPTSEAVAAAQLELDTLAVPPTCPVPTEGSFPDTMKLSADQGAPGSSVTVTSVIPYQLPDNSYDRKADTVVELWWDANPGDWVQLFADPGSVPGTLLGSGGTGSCFLSVTITIPPDAVPGDHQIVALSTDVDRTGAALFGTAVVHVTG
jgi:hypothetical protein